MSIDVYEQIPVMESESLRYIPIRMQYRFLTVIIV